MSNRADRLVAVTASLLTLVLLASAIWPISAPGGDVPGIVHFLGRFHPILVHLPIGFIAALVVLEVLDRGIESCDLHHATYVMSWLAAGAALLAVAAGALLAYPGHYSAHLLFWHRWWGVLTAIGAVWMLAWRIRQSPGQAHGWSFVYHPLLGATAALLVGAGHYGGSLTHGSDYLTAYLPESWRPLLNLPPREEEVARDWLADPQEEVVYVSLIEPILRTSCVSCHGIERQRGGLRLDAHEFILLGGESGSDLGLLAEVLTQPLDHKMRMPPKDKPQLDLDEVALLQWWVRHGASETARVRDLPATGQIGRILQNLFGVDPDADAVPTRDWDEIVQLVQELNTETGANLRRIARDQPTLEIEFLHEGVVFGDAELEQLIPIQNNLLRLNLSRSSITDDGLRHLAGMKNLRRLDLSTTSVTDAGLAHLAGLRHLDYLNLYETAVTDEGLQHLKNLSNLRRIYLWRTKVSNEGIEQLQASLRDQLQADAWQAEIRELEQRLRASEVQISLGGAGISDDSESEPEPESEPETEFEPAAPESSAEEIASAEAVDASCPITGRASDPAHTVTHEGRDIAFCCSNCVAKFQADPESVLATLNSTNGTD
jgi:uncharacterized membrane protein/mono/diheme cytochrome c family protein